MRKKMSNYSNQTNIICFLFCWWEMYLLLGKGILKLNNIHTECKYLTVTYLYVRVNLCGAT